MSVDSKYVHLAWVNTPREQGGLGPTDIPLVADITRSISRDYGVLLEVEGHTLRYDEMGRSVRLANARVAACLSLTARASCVRSL